MIKSKKTLIMLLTALLAVVCLFFSLKSFEGSGDSLSSDRLTYSAVKYSIAQVAPQNDKFSDSRKGLLLYAYDSGATAEFKNAFSGQFEAEIKASSANYVQPDLSAYSFVFTSLNSNDSFSVTIEDNGTETSAYVTVDGDRTGIVYNVDDSWDGQAHGYTSNRNESVMYTRTLTEGTTFIKFDPQTMEISVGDGSSYKTVWILSQDGLDGKLFGHIINSMDKYTVSIEFTSVKYGQKGQLTIYSICGEDYGQVSLPQIVPILNTSVTENAIVGEEYSIFAPNVYDYADKLTDEDFSYAIYYADEVTPVAQGAYTSDAKFTPSVSGNYYLYFSSTESEAQGYFKIKAYDLANVSINFETSTLSDSTVGVNAELSIPTRNVISNLFADGLSRSASVKITKGGITVFSNESGEFDYIFAEEGEYQIIYYVTVCGNEFFADAIVVTVDSSIAGVSKVDIEKEYLFGDEFTVPQAKIYISGLERTASSYVVSPSNKTISQGTFTLDEVGIYTVRYSYDTGSGNIDFSYDFTVNYQAKDLFIAGDKTTISYDDTVGNCNLGGMLVSMRANASSVTYSKTLDLSNNTKTDTLLELYTVSSAPGADDMTGFYVYLTDKLNPSNYLTIRVVAGVGNAAMHCFIRAKASNQQAYTAWYKSNAWVNPPYEYTDVLDNAMNHNSGGFMSRLNMKLSSLITDIENTTFVLYYDASEKAIYSAPAYSLKHDASYRENLVVDFDDTNCFSNLWMGFTDDSQVELSIAPFSIANEARFKIINVDGTVFGGTTMDDNTAPNFTIDYEGASSTPLAELNTPFKVFNVIATDDICASDAIKTKYEVYYGNEEITVNGGYFTPTKTGYYTINYEVSDGYGNTAYQSVEVQAVSSIEDVKLTLTTDWQDSLEYGFKMEIPEYSTSGGSGNVAVTVTVKHGEETEVITSGEYTALEEGEYIFTITAKDYLEKTDISQKTYNVTFESQIVFYEDLFNVPPSFIDGSGYIFDAYTASYYTADGEEHFANGKIEITDGSGTYVVGEDGLYTPSSSATVTSATVKLIFEATADGVDISKTLTRVVPIKVVENVRGFMAEYFVASNATLSMKNQYMSIATIDGAKDVKLEYVRPVNADDFGIQFKANDTDGIFDSNFTELKITLVDKNDSKIKVEMSITKNGEGLLFVVSGGTARTMLGSLTATSTQNIEIDYSNSTKTLTGVGGSDLGSVTKTAFGKDFEGFTSNEVFITVELIGVYADSIINLVSINNQQFFNTAVDTATPQIIVDGSYSGMFTSGTEITLPVARAYDVLNYTSPATITVTGPDGEPIKAIDGTLLDNVLANRTYTIKPTEYGAYSVSYNSRDAYGRTRNMAKDILIYDDILPTVTLNSSLPLRVWTGTAVAIPSYTISDNDDISKVQVIIYYSDNSGNIYTIKNNTITTSVQGEYTVYFYLVDENGNYNVQTFSFTSVDKA